jgi:dolichyl-diphosphooligosaccharide--protein glycosyltransferase
LQKKVTATAVTVNKKVTAKSQRRAARQQARPKVSRNSGLIAILLAAIVLLVYYPNIGPLPDGQKPAIDLATRPLFAPSNAWCDTADWLRANTPEPFGTPDAYYGLYKLVNEKGGFEYPSSAYGILSWWDYGYWIARVGRRVPVTNPGTGPSGTAPYFTAQDGSAAAPMLSKLGARYVIVDNEIASYDSKFHALASLSGSSYSEFYDVFLQKQDDKYVSAIMFYPEYYRSMVIRLYNFDGKAVVPTDVNVIAFKGITTQDGRSYKEIIETKTFSSYDEAQGFVLANKNKDYILVGQDPFKSPVPLEELKEYKLVYASNQKITTGSTSQSNIKIFEYQEEVR